MVKNVKVCSNCGGELVKRGFVRRIQKNEYGETTFIKIPRYSCKQCGKWHRFIPDNVEPYKHYRKDILDGFKKHTLSNEDWEFEDYPSETTIKRWSNEVNK